MKCHGTDPTPAVSLLHSRAEASRATHVLREESLAPRAWAAGVIVLVFSSPTPMEEGGLRSCYGLQGLHGDTLPRALLLATCHRSQGSFSHWKARKENAFPHTQRRGHPLISKPVPSMSSSKECFILNDFIWWQIQKHRNLLML